MALAYLIHSSRQTVSVYADDDSRCSVELSESDLVLLIDALRDSDARKND